MITTYGKQVIAKYLAGQVSSPFSHLAIGTGPYPGAPATETGLEANTRLDAEALRVPIDSVSVGNNEGDLYLSLSAVLPAEQRYEISELGVYTAYNDTESTSKQDTNICHFSRGEGWEQSSSPTEISYCDEIDGTTPGNLDTALTTDPGHSLRYAFFTDSSNSFFTYAGRNKYATAKNLNDVLAVRFDMSTQASIAGGAGEYLSAPISVNLASARSSDQLVLTFAIINKDATLYGTDAAPDFVHIMLEFKSASGSSDYYRFQVAVQQANGASDVDAPETLDIEDTPWFCRNHVISGSEVNLSQNKQSTTKSDDFSWGDVGVINLYVYGKADVGGAHVATDDDFYVLLDNLQFVSNNRDNPNYGLVAYSVVQNPLEETIKKYNGERTRVEYRIGIDLGG